ncbi:unnamed protein product [Caenorhabditis brenneri]
MDPNEKVFENSFLLEQILSHALSDIVTDFNYRLINKKFNNAFLVVLRKEFRSMNIKFQSITGQNIDFWINGRKLCSTKMPQFFEFLNKVANLKVENLRVRNSSHVSLEHEKTLHDAVHSKLIGSNISSIRRFVGLEQTCSGCTNCFEISKIAMEYGHIWPPTLEKLQNVPQNRRIIITDRMLHMIANHCIKNSKSENMITKKLRGIIRPHLVQNNLTLWISECRQMKDVNAKVDHFPMPLEVLEAIIGRWKVKSLRINFVYWDQMWQYEDGWSKETYFSSVRFNDIKDSVKESQIKLEDVEVDLADSFYCQRDFETADSNNPGHRGYDNLIENLRRVFAVNRITIRNGYIWDYDLNKTKTVIENLLQMVKNQSNLLIRIEYFIRFHTITGGEKVDIMKYFLPDGPRFLLYGLNRQIKPHLPPKNERMIRWIGRKFKMENTEQKLNMELSLFTLAQKPTDRHVENLLKWHRRMVKKNKNEKSETMKMISLSGYGKQAPLMSWHRILLYLLVAAPIYIPIICYLTAPVLMLLLIF